MPGRLPPRERLLPGANKKPKETFEPSASLIIVRQKMARQPQRTKIMDKDMRKDVDSQRPGEENKQAPRVREFSPRDSRAQAVNQEDRKGSSGSTSDNPRGDLMTP
jgi:hypothetical protein